MSQARATCAGLTSIPLRDLVERAEDAQPARIEVLLHPAPALALGEILFAAILAGEESRGEREVGDDADALRARIAPAAVLRSSRGRTGCIAAAASRSADSRACRLTSSAWPSRSAVRLDAPIAFTLPCFISRE